MGGIETVAAALDADLAARLPSQNKKQREGLALLVATALQVRSVNLNELAAALPRAAERLDMRYQWISRLLGNALIDIGAVMAPFAREVLARAAPSTGPSPPACGRPSRTPHPPKKSPARATQKRRALLDLLVQTRTAKATVLPPAPHPSAAPLGRLEK